MEKVDVRERWGNRNGMGRHRSQEDQTKVRGPRRWARSKSRASSEKRNKNTGTLGFIGAGTTKSWQVSMIKFGVEREPDRQSKVRVTERGQMVSSVREWTR